MARIRRLLVPYDFSESADAALEAAVGLAAQLGARVDLLHVYHRPVELLSPYGIPLPPSIDADIRARAEQRLAEKLKAVRGAGLAGEAHVREGAPPLVIAEAASQFGSDLIVMGTRGLTGIEHVLLGSVTERTVREAPCPVFSVKAGDDDA